MGRLAYVIHTPRLAVRCWSPQDAAALQEAVDASLEQLRRWMDWAGGEPEPPERKAARLAGFRARFDAGRDFTYGLFDRAERRVLGGAGLHQRIGAGAGEIGYWIHVDHTGRGLATEAAAALVRVGFEVLKLGRIEIHCDPANAASAAVAGKLGFAHQVTVPGCVQSPQATPRDTMIWAMLRPDYDRSAAAAAAVDVEAFDAAGEALLAASGVA